MKTVRVEDPNFEAGLLLDRVYVDEKIAKQRGGLLPIFGWRIVAGKILEEF